MIKPFTSVFQFLLGNKVFTSIVLTVFLAIAGSILFSQQLKVSGQNPDSEAETTDAATEEKQKTKSCCGTENGIVETHTLVGSYYSLKDGQESTLMFNNKGPEPLVVTPTFYSLSGDRLNLPDFTIAATSYQEVDLQVLLAAYLPQFQEGSLHVTHHGIRLQLGAQFKIFNGGMLFDEQFITPATRFPSSKMESVWWMPGSQADTKFIISNTTDVPVIATVKVDGTAPRQQQAVDIELAPHQTRVLDVLRDLVGHQNGTLQKTGGISITHNGGAGAVMARLLVSKASTGFSSVVNFVDPISTRSSKLNGGGLRIGTVAGEELEQIVVARNVGSQPSAVRGQVPYTNNGNVVFINIPQVQLAPGEAKIVDVKNAIKRGNLPGNITYAGIELEYITAPGSVVMNALSVSESGQQVFQVPLLDPERMPSSAGGFPWKVDGDYTTAIFIKNETNVERKYTARLTYEGGGYILAIKKLKVGETVMIDFKQLRDSQTPDSNGNRIPLNIDRGQIAWSAHGADNKVISGRSEQVNAVKGVSSTYACYNCCPDSQVFLGAALPEFVSADVGGIYPFGIAAQNESCYGGLSPIFGFGGYNWTSADPSVASIDYLGSAEAVAPGYTWMYGIAEGYRWHYRPSLDCYYDTVYGNGGGEMEVRPNVQISSFKAVGKNQRATIRVQVSNNSSNQPITLTLSPGSGTGSANFTSNNSNTRTITQTEDVEITGVTESSTMDNMRIKATFNNRQLDDEDFTVISVTLSINFTGTVATDNSARSAQQNIVGTVQLGGPFLTSGTGQIVWGHAVEIVGTVLPSNYSDPIVLQREVVATRSWNENNMLASTAGCIPPSPTPCNDLSDPQLRDDNPQSGGSNGKVYDLDTPGINLIASTPTGAIRRRRTNFRQWATISQSQGGTTVDVRVSTDIQWFQRISIEKMPNGTVQINQDVTMLGRTDNIVGLGTTPLSWDLTP